MTRSCLAAPQEVLQPCGQLELEVCPVFLVPDTNAFVDHLAGLKALLLSSTYILVVPLIGEGDWESVCVCVSSV